MAHRDVSAYFDAYARDFDAIYGHRHCGAARLINRYLRRSMFLRYRCTIEGCHPIEGKSVIDIGCGPGHYCVALARLGAGRVVGIDFAPGMVALAAESARKAGVAEKCHFILGDFLNLAGSERFDYAIMMGLMDYVREPAPLIDRALAVTGTRAFISFPVRHGFLAWQRRLRYRRKTDLYMYDRKDIERLFAHLPEGRVSVEKLHRDFLVTVSC